jgi:hypothetical protein
MLLVYRGWHHLLNRSRRQQSTSLPSRNDRHPHLAGPRIPRSRWRGRASPPPSPLLPGRGRLPFAIRGRIGRPVYDLEQFLPHHAIVLASEGGARLDLRPVNHLVADLSDELAELVPSCETERWVELRQAGMSLSGIGRRVDRSAVVLYRRCVPSASHPADRTLPRPCAASGKIFCTRNFQQCLCFTEMRRHRRSGARSRDRSCRNRVVTTIC